MTAQQQEAGIGRRPTTQPRRTWQTWLIGRPLPTADAAHQTIGRTIGLAVFASDALSSTAYATQEILVVLAAAGTIAFGYAFPIALGIVGLLTVVTISYQQTIHAYPGGGGAYIVARDNLGELPAQIAAAALLTDYILGLMFLTLGTGLVRYLLGSLGTVADPPPLHALEAVAAITPFLILHAFSSGTTALTGVEAISNGIPAFKEPRSRNAAITLIWMSVILGTLFLGITFLAGEIHALPSEGETVISQLARTVFDSRGSLYLMLIAATTIILIMAANTSFADFPRLSALVAGDGFLPRQFTYRGSRLVYSRGIAALAVGASLLIV